MENYSKEELRKELLKRGFTNIGPLTATTRKLYINKILKDDDRKGNIFALSSDDEFKEATKLTRSRSRSKHKDVLNTPKRKYTKKIVAPNMVEEVVETVVIPPKRKYTKRLVTPNTVKELIKTPYRMLRSSSTPLRPDDDGGPAMNVATPKKKTVLRTPARPSMGPLHSTVIGDSPVYNHRQSLYELSDEEILTAESPILASKSPRTRTPSKVMQVEMGVNTSAWLDQTNGADSTDYDDSNVEDSDASRILDKSVFTTPSSEVPRTRPRRGRPPSVGKVLTPCRPTTAAAVAMMGPGGDASTPKLSKMMMKPTNNVALKPTKTKKAVVRKASIIKNYVSTFLMTFLYLFFAVLAVLYVVAGLNQQSLVSDTNMICASSEKTKDGVCKKTTDLQFIRDFSAVMAGKAGRYDCNESGVSQRSMSLIEVEEYLRRYMDVLNGSDDNVSSTHSMNVYQQKLNTIITMIRTNPQWQLKLLDVSGSPTNIDNVVAIESILSDMPLMCRAKRSINLLLYIGGVTITLTLLITLLVAGYKLRRLHLKENKDEVSAIVEKVLDTLQTNNENYQLQLRTDPAPTLQPHMSIVNVRDIVIPVNERVEKMQIWKQVVHFIEEQESRIRKENILQEGETYRVWKWIQPSLTVESPNQKNWQGKAIDSTTHEDGSYYYATECIKIRNMFNENYEITEENLNILKNSLLTKCGLDCQTLSIDIDIVTSCIYMRFPDKIAGGNAFKAINSTWYNGSLVTVKYIRPDKYDIRFPITKYKSKVLIAAKYLEDDVVIGDDFINGINVPIPTPRNLRSQK